MGEPTRDPAQPLRLVQVGAGAMGRAWLDTIGADPDVELVGLVDLDPEVARGAAAGAGHAGLPVATSLAELLGRGHVDAVVDVTVPTAHHGVNTEVLLAGLPVLCEKPLSESLAECLSMVAVSELTGQLLMVSQSRRYWRHLDRLRSQLRTLGPVELASCTFARAPHFGGFREEMPHPLLVDLAIHQFDLARDLLGSEPVEVVCESSNPSWSWYRGDAAATAVFGFASGARFTFDGSWCSPGLETSWNGSWRLSTAAGTAVWDGDTAPVAQRADGSGVAGLASQAPEQLAGSLAEFVRALRTGSTPAGEVHANVLSVAMVDAATTSAQTGAGCASTTASSRRTPRRWPRNAGPRCCGSSGAGPQPPRGWARGRTRRAAGSRRARAETRRGRQPCSSPRWWAGRSCPACWRRPPPDQPSSGSAASAGGAGRADVATSPLSARTVAMVSASSAVLSGR